MIRLCLRIEAADLDTVVAAVLHTYPDLAENADGVTEFLERVLTQQVRQHATVLARDAAAAAEGLDVVREAAVVVTPPQPPPEGR